jgi:DNA-binding NarL/FixJ family response regulator
LTDAASTAVRTVAILADDLIWSTRLADAVRAAGANPTVVRRLGDLADLSPEAVIIDLTARAYDGVAAVRAARAAGAAVVAVGQHDDAAMRKAAIAAGASRVYTYRALFEDGARLLGRWLDS